MSKVDSEKGKVYGRLTVVEELLERSKDRRKVYLCKCSCGKSAKVTGKMLRSGKTKSCGCLNSERISAIGSSKAQRIGEYLTREHPLRSVYSGMMARCYNKGHKYYEYYGGRGIGVCERWRKGLKYFVEDMGPRPEGHTLDRIDNDKGYFPGNCRWATMEQQCQNRRPNSGWRKKRCLESA